MQISAAASALCIIVATALISQIKPSKAEQIYWPCSPDWVNTCEGINNSGQDTCITYGCVAFPPPQRDNGPAPIYGIFPTCVANFRTEGGCTYFDACASAGTCVRVPGTSQTGGPLSMCSPTATFQCSYPCQCAAPAKGKAEAICIPRNPNTTSASSCTAPQQ
jgi:hypothetical protein